MTNTETKLKPARKKSKLYGRKKKLYPVQELDLAYDWLEGKVSLSDLAKKLKLTQPVSAYSFIATRLKYGWEKK